MSLLRLFLLAFLLPVLVSCQAQDSDITAYRQADASFTAVFPSPYGSVSCDAVRKGDTLTFTVTEPARSAGITVLCDMARDLCSVQAGETIIPLSADASADLWYVVDALYAPLEEPVRAVKSADGTDTVLETEYGSVTLGEDGLPKAVDAGGRVVELFFRSSGNAEATE